MPAQLTGRQRKALRGLAHSLEPIVQVGQGGISAGVAAAVDAALLSHELIKVRLHQPADKKAAAQELADVAGAALCGLVGHTVILYRPHPEKPRIRLEALGQ
jgi:RNA-binding protein